MSVVRQDEAREVGEHSPCEVVLPSGQGGIASAPGDLKGDGFPFIEYLGTKRSPATLANPRALRGKSHFTPTSSSWLNQVERWFGLITDRMTRRRTFRSVAELERAIYQRLAHWNNDPQALVWTAAAGVILDMVRRYLELAGTAHWRLCFYDASCADSDGEGGSIQLRRH